MYFTIVYAWRITFGILACMRPLITKWFFTCTLLLACGKTVEIPREMHENGEVRHLDIVNSQGELVEVRKFHYNGIRQSMVEIRDQKRHGKFREWRSDGMLLRTGQYNYDTTTGVWREWYDDRKLRAKGELHNQLRSGLWEEFHADGSIAARMQYQRGIPQGEWVRYDKHGRVVERNSCHSSVKHGLFMRLDSAGRIREKGTCDFGKRQGLWEEFFPDGTIHRRTQWQADKPHGVWVWLRYNASLEKQESWKEGARHGNFVETSITNDTLLQGNFLNGTGMTHRWCKEGGLCAETTWVDGIISGRLFFMSADSGILQEEFWSRGLKDSMSLHRHGKLVRSGTYRMGKPHGIWRTWWPSGILRDSLHFQEGELWGLQFYHDSTGKLIKKERRQGKRGQVRVEILGK